MNKIIVAVIGIVVIAAGFFAVAAMQDKGSEDQSEDSANTSSSNISQGKAACELLTLDDAKAILGVNAVLVEGSGEPNLATTEEVNVDNCTYSADGATLGDMKQITIQRQYGDTSQVKNAYENYRKEFPGEDVAGLGDTAYYVMGSDQVQVLKGDYWLHVAGGSMNGGSANRELVLDATKTALNKI